MGAGVVCLLLRSCVSTSTQAAYVCHRLSTLPALRFQEVPHSADHQEECFTFNCYLMLGTQLDKLADDRICIEIVVDT